VSAPALTAPRAQQTFTSSGKITDKGADIAIGAAGALGGISFDKLSVCSKGVAHADLSLHDAVPSTAFFASVEDGVEGSGAKAKAELGVSDVAGSFFGRLNADLLAGPTFAPAAVFTTGAFSLGAQAGLKAGALEEATYDAGVAYVTDGYTAAVQSFKKFKGVSVGYYHALSFGAAAAKVCFDGTAEDKKKAVCGKVGVKYVIDSATTATVKLGVRAPPRGRMCMCVCVCGSLTHARRGVQSCGGLAAKYEQQVNENVKLTLGAKINVTDVGSDDHRAGFGLNFSG
jgi:hypothetical protein